MASATRVKFFIRAEPSAKDPKTTVINLLWMQLMDEPGDERYAFSDDHKKLGHHDALFKLTPAIEAKKDMTTRWSSKIFRVLLQPEVAELYVDSHGNPRFGGVTLELFSPSRHLIPEPEVKAASTVAVTAPAAALEEHRSVASILKKASIVKFSPKNFVHAEPWINIFEEECTRLGLVKEQFAEGLRLFVEDTAETWYSTTRYSTTNLTWEEWRESFLDTFGSRGLAGAKAALSFKYYNGPVADYAVKKLSMLANYNPKMHELDKIVLVSVGLPQFMQDRICLRTITSVGKLLALLNTFEKVPQRSFSSNTSNVASSSSTSSPSPFDSLKRTPCGYCKSKFDRIFFHAEKDCQKKFRDNQRKALNANSSNSRNEPKTHENKAIHNFTLEELQAEIANLQKNE